MAVPIMWETCFANDGSGGGIVGIGGVVERARLTG